MIRVVILHGTNGSPKSNWLPWLADNLKAQSIEVIVPQMSTPNGQNLLNWLDEFSQSVAEVNNRTILIGHSAGATFILRLLETLSIAVAGTFLVAGFTGELGIPEYDLLNHSFVKDEFNWTKIRGQAGEINCFSGENDPYVPASQGVEIAEKLNVQLNLIAEGGHLNKDSGFNEFPLLLEKVNLLINNMRNK